LLGVTIAGDVNAVAERVDARLAVGEWDLSGVDRGPGDVSAAAEVAVFALKLAGKRRQARSGGRFGRLVVRFALAACLALATVAAACDKPDANPEATAVAISQLPPDTATSATITAQPRAGPAQFDDLLLLDPGTDAQPWALMAARGGDTPILVDRVGAGLDTVGSVYRLAAQPVAVGTRDGAAQFLDPLQAAEATGSDPNAAAAAKDALTHGWAEDERYLATTRAIAGQPTALDAAYNADAASTAGGTHTYLNGVVLRVEPDQPVLQVIDQALLVSGRPTRAEDVVYVAIRPSERSLYEPGQVVNLNNVVMDRQTTDVDGQPTTVFVANAALDGARVEPTGTVDLQALLQPRLQRVDDDVALQAQDVGASATPAAGAAPTPAAQLTATPGSTAPAQPIIVQQQRYGGPSLVDDFLIYMWLSNSGFYRGSTVIINNPPASPNRPSGGVLYSPPPASSGTSPSTVASSQAASRSTALQAARGAVSGQASGTGGGVAATNKSAADASAHVGAATSKSASVAGAVSASSAGKSVSSAPSGSSSTASRSAGSTSAGSRGSVGSSSSSSGGKSIGSGSSGGFGGKGISGGSSSS
jgi:hypothetical protein